MLVLSEVELIFFTVASMGLHFGFVLETVLTIQGCFIFTAEQRLHRAKAFSASHPTPQASRLGVHKELGGDTAGTADPNWPKGYSILYDMSCSAYKAGGRRRKGGTRLE